MFNFFIDRPVFSTVISLIITLAGALAGFDLPISQYPQIVPPQVQVQTTFPGANADVVVQSVAAPLEQQINGAKSMLYMDSKSANDGSYNLIVTFDVGTNQDLAAVDVQNRLAVAQSSLPADVIRQGVIVRKQSTDFLEVIALTSPERRFDTTFLSNYALLNLQENVVPCVFVGIFLQPDANALDVAKQVTASMNTLAQRFPAGMVWSVPYTTTPFVTESLREVMKTLGVAFLLVMFVVFLFLQTWRATLIPMLAVPVSLVGTFAAFAALGFSINTLTLFGLVLAIGIVVDDAIVVVEAAQHRIDQEHVSPAQATKEAMADVGGPVVAIALSLAAVFVPVAFLGGLTGQLYKQFALTLATSVILSAVVALTLTPALCALLLRPAAHSDHPGPLGRFFDLFNRLFESFRDRYTDSVVKLARHTALVALTFAVLLGALYGLIKTRPTGLVPDEDQGYMFVVLQLPPGASLERTNAAVNDLNRIAHEIPGIEGVASLVGFNLLTGLTTSYNSTTFIRFKPWSEREKG